MANEEHLARLKQGVEAWTRWREEIHEKAHAWPHQVVKTSFGGAERTVRYFVDESREDKWRKINRDYRPDLTGADLSEMDLYGVNLWGTDLSRANLIGANLSHASLMEAVLIETDLTHAHLELAWLTDANLSRANLAAAQLSEADLIAANLTGADLIDADLSDADLSRAKFSNADLRGANLTSARLVETDFEGANLTGCTVYGISAWRLNLAGAQQSNLVITPADEPKITVDNLEVAQFIYLLLHNEKVRQVIDTITSKAVLILGRFTPERKAVLDAMRDELRNRNYLPIVFDFEKPASRDLTESISMLAHMARFIIADLTEAKSIPQELQRIVPDLPSVPVQPVLQASAEEYSMFEHFKRFPWVLETYRYESLEEVIASLTEKVIAPAELKANELSGPMRR
jgi:uncharacterized protein YjbI with pentapeptide repeats